MSNKTVVVRKVTRGPHLYWDDFAAKFTKGLQTATVMTETDARIFFEGMLEDGKVKLMPAKVTLISTTKKEPNVHNSF